MSKVQSLRKKQVQANQEEFAITGKSSNSSSLLISETLIEILSVLEAIQAQLGQSEKVFTKGK
jgi:hypothetical protein